MLKRYYIEKINDADVGWLTTNIDEEFADSYIEVTKEQYTESRLKNGLSYIEETEKVVKTPLEILQEENALLKTQIQAMNENQSFLEDCIIELAQEVYK